MSGSVSPFTGARPADIETLYTTWNVKLARAPMTRRVPSRSRARRAVSIVRSTMKAYRPSTASTPMNPCSSASTEKMKSLWATGRKPCWPWVPFMKPLPQSPPEPTVMRAWSCW